MLKRRIFDQLEKEIGTDEIIVITGPRQVGKTTTLQYILDQIPSKNKQYFDLENIKDRQLFEEKNYDLLIQKFQSLGLTVNEKMYIALDEIQLLENIPSVVKYLYDHYRIKFFLTGSSSFYIKNRFSESMAGRKMIYELLPLTFQEFLDFKGVNYFLPEELSLTESFDILSYETLHTYYEEYIEYGGLPKVVLTTDKERKKKLLQEIFSSYINLDVAVLADFKSTNDLRRVIQLLAVRIGSKLNITEIANITGMSRTTIDTYIEFLEDTYLVKTLPAYSNSKDVQIRLLRKPYFIDTGIANVNADLSSGSKFENTIRHQLSFYGKLFYFSNKDGEIDFILEYKDKKIAIEVKETPAETSYNVLTRRAGNLDISTTRIIGKEHSVKFKNYLWGGLIK